MAGTRGIAQFKGLQLQSKLMRDNHFDVNNKINENKIDIQWHNHREILEDTKIDVFVQANNQVVAGLGALDLTTVIGGTAVSKALTDEGIVDGAKVEFRITGTQDTPVADVDGDPIYGKMRFDEVQSKYFVDFYSLVGGVETAYTFGAEAGNLDVVYIQRTNLSVIPVDAIVNGGAGFVEGATDAKAYMNLVQLMKDIYKTGTLDNDGNANFSKSLQERIEDFSLTDTGFGASLVGVVTNEDYTGVNVQEVLNDLAQRMVDVENGGAAEVEATHTRDAATTNGYFAEKTGENAFASLEERIDDIENVVDTQMQDKEDRITHLETKLHQQAFEAVGGETEVTLDFPAEAGSVFFSLNGAIQAPGINYTTVADEDGNIIKVNIAPDTLKGADAVEGLPADVVFIWFNKAVVVSA